MTLEFGIFLYVIIIGSAVFHEYMHGWMAYKLGDSTAKDLGRLTLNPLKHMDPVGTVLLPLFLIIAGFGFIGWAKPVPYNPYNLSDQRYGSTKVAFAGPGANLVIALLLAVIVRLDIVGAQFYLILSWVIFINIFLALFNLIPVPPLDGSKLLLDRFPRYFHALQQLSYFGIIIALFVAWYVLSPIANFLFFLFTGEHFVAISPFL
jgi:Zn-dependent protease